MSERTLRYKAITFTELRQTYFCAVMILPKPSPRILAQHHLWSAWFGGLALAMLLLAFWLLLLAMPSMRWSWSSLSEGLVMLLLCPPLVGVFLGVPSLIGAFIRRRGIEWSFATAGSRSSLVWRVGLVVEGSVLGLLLAYLLGSFLLSSHDQAEPLYTAQLFFGLSLPWLLSSVLAALRLWPGRMPEPTPEICATRTASDS
ncbi:hypothetical protein [Hymenobacter actinosclerus]|uniref:hypothetical protein n=1 Tax=Hymenobacter actinosclerus TaxID=82805 RepID=UPI0015A6198E|nr:hypothetical protein [Hymenobacter actinosclerus]